ncbi:hypothetical protein N3K63_00595 [Microbacterium sp. W1N]|uniref:hypothetical protein n=1 Tax=Microbacterium festucae TaxID=2977531 RepID=UPI0021BFEFD6|nr:hypothetical protein [Microbacterium festucae]MCT9818774.1 hypothetical protein [Microbacterium festucae]
MSARGGARALAVTLGTLALILGFVVAVPIVAPTTAANAAVASDFNPGNIIDDATFYNSNAMDAAAVQQFLDARVKNCKAGYTCLKDYRQTTDTRAADRYCNGYTGRENETAAQIIDNVARSCGISQQVLLVLLEKEQSLVTSSAPEARAYAAATGQGCPDTAPCNPATMGFFYQVYYAARQYEVYRLTPSNWGYQAGRWNTILYHPDASRNCGTQRVYIENQATAGLYIYTPYTPNAAALNNLYGTGDRCSSYGNRNFWRLFTDWFGQQLRSPFGGFNVEVERGKFTVLGWVLDPDAQSQAVRVEATLDGQSLGTFAADDERPDVAAAYPGYGSKHGIRRTFEALGGDHTICVVAKNIGPGYDKDFGCVTTWIETASPYGGAGAEAIPGGVRITGWTLDTDTTDSLDIHVYVDGVGSIHRADAVRPDVGQAFPGFGDRHGIDVSLEAAVGRHEVCVYGINRGLGFNKLLGCSTVEVERSASPVGALETAYAEPGGLRVRGWVVDPNTSAPMSVHVYRGATGTPLTTSVDRPDVIQQYPQAALRSGFDSHIPAPAGRAQVCAYGINVGWGSNSTIGCQDVEVRAGNPYGGVDVTASGESVRLRGWVIDPDTTEPVAVHYYIDGVGSVTRADIERADVGRVYPGYGSRHGVDATVKLAAGTHTICAYGINVGAGVNALLGCTDVTVKNMSPFGGTDATVLSDGVRLRGWVIDPDTSDPVTVHVYVNGAGHTVTAAGVARPDVAAVYPEAGANHGIDTTLKLASGAYDICSYGINVGQGQNALLGCQKVTVP